MRDCINAVSDFSNVREAVCINAQKTMDACRDQNCMENLRVFLTRDSQEILDCATSVTARSTELLYCDVNVEPTFCRDGYYTVDIQYYCKIVADALVRGVRPSTIYGLCTYTQRATLYGGEGCVSTFSSNGDSSIRETPVGVVSAVDPMVLRARIKDRCGCSCGSDSCGCGDVDLPRAVERAFDDDLVFDDMDRELFITLGQFSIVSLQRETQLLIPSYDYCVPSQTCDDDSGFEQDPCSAFADLSFPVSDFFPSLSEDTTICGDNGGHCGCGGSRSGSARSSNGATASEAAEVRETSDSSCGCGSNALVTTSGNGRSGRGNGNNGVRAIGSGSNRR